MIHLDYIQACYLPGLRLVHRNAFNTTPGNIGYLVDRTEVLTFPNTRHPFFRQECHSSKGFPRPLHTSLDGIIGLPNYSHLLPAAHNIYALIAIQLRVLLLHRRCLKPIWILRLVGRYIRNSLLAAYLGKFPKNVEQLCGKAYYLRNRE